MKRLRQIGLLAANDLRLTVRDRAAFFWMLVLPLGMMWIFGQINRDGGPPKPSLAVEDRDGGWLARAFVGELASDRIALTEIRPGSRLDKPPTRRLVIPAGFTAQALAGKQQVLHLEKQTGSDQELSLAVEVDLIRAIVRTVGRMAEIGPPPAADPQGNAARLAFAELARRPPLVTVAVSTAGKGRPVPSGFAQSVPGILAMTVLMMTVIYGGVFLTLEKKQGMIRRQATLPLSRFDLLAGKLTGRLAIAGLQAILLLVAGRFLFGFSWGSSPLGLALLLASFVFAVAGLSTFLGAVLATPEQASSVGWISSMLLAALGGCWWPSEVMPRWLWKAVHIFPTPWAMDGFHALISFGEGARAVLLPAAALIGFGLLFTLLGSRFLKTG
jgi:ABC-2 type transport system permease protein